MLGPHSWCVLRDRKKHTANWEEGLWSQNTVCHLYIVDVVVIATVSAGPFSIFITIALCRYLYVLSRDQSSLCWWGASDGASTSLKGHAINFTHESQFICDASACENGGWCHHGYLRPVLYMIRLYCTYIRINGGEQRAHQEISLKSSDKQYIISLLL